MKKRHLNPSEVAESLKRNPNRSRSVNDPPPKIRFSENDIRELKRQRTEAIAHHNRLTDQLCEFVNKLPSELRQLYRELQSQLDSAAEQTRDLDNAIKTAQTFVNAVKNLKGPCRDMIADFDPNSDPGTLRLSVEGAIRKFAKRVPKKQVINVVREAFAQLVDPSLRDGSEGETYQEFLERVKKSRAWSAAFSSRHERYNKEATAELDIRLREEKIESMKKLGKINRALNLNADKLPKPHRS